MRVHWTEKGRSDLTRLHQFLAPVNPQAAANVIQALVRAPERLLEHPRIGERLDAYDPREVRRLLVGNYEIRYEIRDSDIFILRIWHTREKR